MTTKSTFSNSTSKSYALALYELAKENSELDQVQNGLGDLKLLLNKSAELKEMILSPTVSKDEKKNVLLAIADRNNFSEILKKFLSFLSTKNRLFFLEKIIESFLDLISNIKGELKAKLVSPRKLSPEELKKIQSELSTDFRSPLNIDYKYDPSLIAGLIIQVGSVMIDTSIKSKLKKLEKNMLET